MTPKVLTELQKVKFENVSLRIQIAEQQLGQLQQQGQALLRERNTLIEQMRKTAGAAGDDLYNPQTHAFQSRPKPVVPPKAPAPPKP